MEVFCPPTQEESAQPTTCLSHTHTQAPLGLCTSSWGGPGCPQVPFSWDEARSPPLLSREGAGGGAPHTGLWGSPAPAFPQSLPLLESPSGSQFPSGCRRAGKGAGQDPLAGPWGPPPSGGAAAPSPVPSGHSAFTGDLPVPCY